MRISPDPCCHVLAQYSHIQPEPCANGLALRQTFAAACAHGSKRSPCNTRICRACCGLQNGMRLARFGAVTTKRARSATLAARRSSRTTGERPCRRFSSSEKVEEVLRNRACEGSRTHVAFRMCFARPNGDEAALDPTVSFALFLAHTQPNVASDLSF